MSKRSYSRTIKVFGAKIKVFGHIEINRPKANPKLRKALQGIHSDLSAQESKRASDKALAKAIRYYESPAPLTYVGKVQIF
jgi:ribosome recycling factor